MSGRTSEFPEWIAKAEGDFLVALREFRVRRNPNYDDVCFHAQQCIEKYLKAALVSKSRAVEKVHDLAALIQACLGDYPMWIVMLRDVDLLSQYAVLFRYPGHTATRQMAQRAVHAMRSCREEIRVGLLLPLDKRPKRRRTR